MEYVPKFLRPAVYKYVRGRKPWALGYVEYKDQQIIASLNSAAIMDTFAKGQPLPQGYAQGLDERMVEFPWLISRLQANPSPLLFDAGSTVNHSFIINQPVIQKSKLSIMTLVPEDKAFWERGIDYLYGDLRELPFRDNWFDGVTCISTLEHVGMDNSIYTEDEAFHQQNLADHLNVIKEVQRTLKPGGKLFLTVPYGIFKLCGFQQVFNREMLAKVVATFGGTVQEQTFFRYRQDGWHVAKQDECDDADYYNIHAGETNSDGAAAARAVACLILRK